jgi:hypothetical protein
MRTNSKIFIYIASVSLAFLSCSSPPTEIAGGASDLEISACSVEGKAVDSLGNVLIGAVVHLRTVDYLSDFPIKDSSIRSSGDTITNSNGLFSFDYIDTGTFIIEVNFHDSLATLISFSINKKDSLKIFDCDTLRPLGVISGRVDINNNVLTEDSKVRIYGLERKVKPDSIGYYFMKVPAGKHKVVFNADSLGFKTEFIVNVRSGEPANGDIRIGTKFTQSFCNDYSCDSLAVRLFLDSSDLTSIAVDSVATKELGRITKLNLSNLSIKKLYTSIEQLQKLNYLDLSHNQLNDSLGSIYSLRALEFLYLKGNLITTINRNIENLEFLKTLDISDNELTCIPISITKHNMTTFDISNNKLSISGMNANLISWLDLNDPDWRSSQKPLQ